MAQQLAAHPGGRGRDGCCRSVSTGSLIGVSTHTAVRFADIAATGCLWWFQVYLMRERGRDRASGPPSDRARSAGHRADGRHGRSAAERGEPARLAGRSGQSPACQPHRRRTACGRHSWIADRSVDRGGRHRLVARDQRTCRSWSRECCEATTPGGASTRERPDSSSPPTAAGGWAPRSVRRAPCPKSPQPCPIQWRSMPTAVSARLSMWLRRWPWEPVRSSSAALHSGRWLPKADPGRAAPGGLVGGAAPGDDATGGR